MKNTNLVYEGGKIAVHASIFRAAFPALRLLDFTGGFIVVILANSYVCFVQHDQCLVGPDIEDDFIEHCLDLKFDVKTYLGHVLKNSFMNSPPGQTNSPETIHTSKRLCKIAKQSDTGTYGKNSGHPIELDYLGAVQTGNSQPLVRPLQFQSASIWFAMASNGETTREMVPAKECLFDRKK